MIEKENLSKRGIETERTDVDKRGIVDTVKRKLRSLYSTLSGYRERVEQLIVGAMASSFSFEGIAGLRAGETSVGIASILMLAVLLGTAELVDWSQKVQYIDGISPRVRGFLSGSALATGAVAVVGFESPTMALVQTMALIWGMIWIPTMWFLMLKGPLWKAISWLWPPIRRLISV